MKPTILLVEDEAALITLLRYNLEKEGFRLVEAHDGTITPGTAPGGGASFVIRLPARAVAQSRTQLQPILT